MQVVRTAALAICLVLFPVLTALPAARAAAEYRVLPHVKVELDGQPVDVGPVVQDATAYLVPLDKAVTALTRGQATPEPAAPDGAFRARWGEQAFLEIPTNEADASAVVLGRRVPLPDTAQRVTLPGQPERLMIDLKVLAGLIGITADQDGATFSLFTPEYWSAQLGLGGAAEGRTLRNLPLLPDMGISPPARSLLIWVRPREQAYVQIYKLSGERPEPLLGVNAFGRRVTHPNPPLGEPQAWSAPPNRPVRVDTLFYDAAPPPADAPKRYGTYVALLSRTTPPGGDVAAGIRDGKIAAADWCIVGVRQRVVRGVILYEPHTIAADDTLAGIAGKFRMPPAMLADLNGLGVNERLTPGEKVVVIGGIDVGEQTRRQKATWASTGYYEVRPEDTIERLAARCGVSPEEFLAANSSLSEGAELEPGEVITLVKPIAPAPRPPRPPNTPPPPEPDVQTDFKTMVIKAATNLLAYTLPTAPVLKRLAAGQAVAVLARRPDKKLVRVAVGDVIGWIPLSLITAPTKAPPPPPVITSGQMTAGTQVVQEALRWVGVPRYEWGGNRIDRGIDCSHFVAAAYARVRQPCPSPPVHNMETYGAMVHWKPGPAEVYGQVQGMPVSPSITSLRPGDRIIFQSNPSSRRDGNHHTGIYVGAYKGMKNAVVHCNSSRNTVSVDEIDRLWRIYRFAVRGAQKRPAGPAMAATTPGKRG